VPDGRIVVFGDVFDDIVVVPSGPIRSDTDTSSAIRTRPGGSAANAAAWLGTLGVPVDFVGRVAEADVARHASALASCGVTPHLIADAELPTGTIVVLVDGDRRSMLTEKGANTRLTADAAPDALLDDAAIIHFTGYSLFGDGREAAAARLMVRAAERGIQVSIDPGSAGFIADLGVERFLAAVDGATLLFPNHEEGRLLSGLDEPESVAAALAERFPVVALTLDTAGAVVATADGVHRVQAEAATVVDPTGAGDAFAAGFLGSWLASADPVLAAKAGAVAGAAAVALTGARPA
jgi:sugar/nucleoside kinase (ribokinase family)